MKLISIRLCNFRQFYGKTPEIFLASGEQNTTIIHGNNGAGKTTLLNAFTWVLYERFSAAFASEEQLVNKRAANETPHQGVVECWVEVGFEHQNKRYQAKRLCRAYKNLTGVELRKSELYLQIAGDDGRWVPPAQSPDDIIGRILPVSLHQYFFFDGERIEQIVRSEQRLEIAEATKTLLGVEVLTRSIKHLKEAKKTLELELANIGDSETKKLLREQKKLEIESETITGRQIEITQELGHQDEFKKAFSNHLLELSGAEDLQKRRDELEVRAKLLIGQLKQAKDTLKKAISTRGYMVFILGATKEFRSIVDDLREKGELPIGIKRQFVSDLLDEKRCICGADLVEGTHAHHQVSAWMDKAGIFDVEETAIRMTAQVDEIEKQLPDFWEEVDRQQNNIA
ncbi:MAG: AAA family ATPase, partial [Coleofasciculaceae cyanobacterium]